MRNINNLLSLKYIGATIEIINKIVLLLKYFTRGVILMFNILQRGFNLLLYVLQSVASATLYLASKVHDETVRLRDLINVCYNTLYRDAAPLRLAEDYWNIRDSIVHVEMLAMRLLQFDTTFAHPHNVII